MKNILMLSGGKDSTAMVLMCLAENWMSVDEIVFFDTGKEFPQMYQHLELLEKNINIPITRLKTEQTFNYYMFDHIKVKGKNIGKAGYGWPSGGVNWCTSKLKTRPAKHYLKAKYGNDYQELIGIAFDEFKRLDNKNQKVYPLADRKITEGECLKYCYDHGYDWGGLYTRFDRVSCWCCPHSNLRELYMLWSFYPDLWEQLKEMDTKAWNSFKSGRSVENFEHRFENYHQTT